MLYHGEIFEALQWLADEMFRSRMLRVELYQTSVIPKLQPDVRTVLFSALRELLVNVSKHSGVKSASVTLGTAGNRVFAIVRDRGVGFDPAPARHDGSGLALGCFTWAIGLKRLAGRLRFDQVMAEAARLA